MRQQSGNLVVQEGTGGAPATWPSADAWLRRQIQGSVLLVFEDAEAALVLERMDAASLDKESMRQVQP